MFNQLSSQSTRFFSNRTVRFGSFFLLALGCGVFGQALLGEMSPSNTVGALNLNGGLFEFMRSGSSATSAQWSPTMMACVLFLFGIVGFLLQPLYLRSPSKPHSSLSKYSSSKHSSSKYSSSKHSPSEHSPSERVRTTQTPSDQAYPFIVLPLIDRLIITPQSIVASTCRSAEAVPKIEFVSRTVESLNQLLVQSAADVIVLTRSEMTLDASEIILGVQQLCHSNFDVITPQRAIVNASTGGHFTQDSPSSSLNSSQALHYFICDIFGFHQAGFHQVEPTSMNQAQNQADTHTSPDCYIVRRKALLSMLNLSRWSSSDVLTEIEITPPSQPVTPHSQVLTRV